jgi:transmembrane sensor
MKGGNSDFSDFLLNDDFIKRISGFENPADYINFINELKKANPDNADNIDRAIEVYFQMKNIHPETSFEQRQKVWKRITHIRARERKLLFMRVAASIILLIGIGGSAYFFISRKSGLTIEKFAESIKPSYNKSQLILSNGNNVEISDYESQIKYSKNGANVIINDSTMVAQQVGQETYNELIVPYGKYNSLELSDGTRIWVNAGSRLVYPPVFSGKTREVFVQGEAYFEVAKDKTRPFYVKTDRFRVEVLGTRFSVQANQKEDLFSAMLIEGEVSLSSNAGNRLRSVDTKLEPGHIALLKDDRKNFEIQAVENPENFIAWKNGYLHFNDEPLTDLLQRISRYYNIEVEIMDPSKSVKISGKLDLKDDPERVLKGISNIIKGKMVKENNKYMFY